MNKISMLIRDAFSPVLSDRSIKKYNKKGLLIEEEIPESSLQPNSVDLRLGSSLKYLEPNQGSGCECWIDPIYKMKYRAPTIAYRINKDPYRCNISNYWTNVFTIKPGQFCLLNSKETLKIPNGIIAFVCGRSSIARMGIQIEQAGLIDAGFNGTITFEIFNQTEYDITLYEGMRVAQVYFLKAQYADAAYGSINKNSKYQHQVEATGSMIDKDPELQKLNEIKG